MRWSGHESIRLAVAILVLVQTLATFPVASAHAADPHPGLEHHRVWIDDNAFAPYVLDVQVGDHVNFTNLQSNQLHTVTADNGAFHSGILFPDDTFEWIANVGGNVTFHCEYVASMHGILRIGPAPAPDTPPTVSIESPREMAKVAGKVTISGVADDADGDWFSLHMRVDGSPWKQINAHALWSVEWDSTVLRNGAHTIEVEARDKWGERSLPAVLHVEVANPTQDEGTFATVAITSPLPNARLAGEVVIEGIAGRQSASQLLEVRVRIDQGAWKVATGEEHWSLSWDTRSAKDGVHRIEAVAYDGKRTGPASKVNVLVTNAGTAQTTISILSPSERSRVNGTIEVRGLADDPDSDAIEVLARLDGGEWQRASGSRAWIFRWDSTTVANGPHVIEVQARTPDRKSAIAKVTLITDNGDRLERPTVSFASPDPSSRVTGTILVRGRANATQGTPLTVQVRVGDGPWESVSGSVKWAWTFNTTGMPNGVHRLRARAFNDVGYSAVAELPVLVSNAPSFLEEIEDPEETQLFTAEAPPKRRPTETDGGRFLPSPGLALALAAVAALALATRRRQPFS